MSSKSSKEPVFRRATPGEGQKYFELIVQYALNHHSEIVPWLNGTIHSDFLEFKPEFLKRENKGRRGGTYKSATGELIMDDLTMVDYRAQLIEEVQLADLLEQDLDERIALEYLFPKATAKSRADNRTKMLSSAQALLGKAMLFWPEPDVISLMNIDAKLTSAYEKVDIIAWVNALKEFCLAGTGNIENNIRIAEESITALKMEKGKFTDYVKDFRAAADNLSRCGSNFTQERIVSLFFKNLDQEQFVQFYANFLDKNHYLNERKNGSLQEAISAVYDYFNSVIRVMEDNASLGNSSQSSNHSGLTSVTSVKGLKHHVNTGKSQDSLVVPHHVLATLMRGNNADSFKRKADEAAGDHKKKAARLDITNSAGRENSKSSGKEKSKSVDFKLKSADKSSAPGICFNWAKDQECKYGDACRYSH